MVQSFFSCASSHSIEPIAVGGHYREMAGRPRELVRLAVGSQVLRD
jgi:hypothetical protein